MSVAHRLLDVKVVVLGDLDRNGELKRAIAEGARMVETLLNRVEYVGHWLLRARSHVRWKSTDRMRITHTRGQAITVRTRPTDNGSAIEWDLVPPQACDATAVYETLKGELEAQVKQPRRNETKTHSRIYTIPMVPFRTEEPVAEQKPEPEPELRSAPAPAVPGLPPVTDLMAGFQSLIAAAQRVEARKASLEELGVRRTALQAELKDLQDMIAAVETRELALMAEDEGDAEGRQAQSVLASMQSLISGAKGGGR